MSVSGRVGVPRAEMEGTCGSRQLDFGGKLMKA